jgi:hypothetical protein
MKAATANGNSTKAVTPLPQSPNSAAILGSDGPVASARGGICAPLTSEENFEERAAAPAELAKDIRLKLLA